MSKTPSELSREVDTLRELSRRLIRELGMLGDPHQGCSVSDCHTLIELEQYGTLTAAQLGRHLLLDKSTISRRLARLSKKALVRSRADRLDGRFKPLVLTASGRSLLAKIDRAADTKVCEALASLSEQQRRTVLDGFRLYVDALKRTQLSGANGIRDIQQRDNADVAFVIRTVMREFDLDSDELGFADPEIGRMYEYYRADRHHYFVATIGERVVGGAGIGPLEGSNDTCELRKMYLLPEARGRSLGKCLLDRCLSAAQTAGYSRCYLETMPQLTAARSLYATAGFERIPARLGNTGRSGCQNYYLKSLD